MRAEKIQSHEMIGRFAPSTTGGVHPGTLLAGLLCWLDARSQSGSVLLRLEDLDRERTKKGYVEAMVRDLDWFGLEFDEQVRQTERGKAHEEALIGLIQSGRVYACSCSRSQIRAGGEAAPDGSYRYPGTCREQLVDESAWREEARPLRLRLDAGPLTLLDESGMDLSGDAAALFGDPILRRRDGSFAYHFASVLDDAAAGVTRVIRGRDLALATLPQVALQKMLGLSTPKYRHHALFLERSGDKLSKFHGAVDVAALRSCYSAEALCGLIASAVGLVPLGTECRPSDLVEGFAWSAVASEDVELSFEEGRGLEF
ncbi:MAG: glutamate--tRNA ligase family protein [Myxococcota bacterium]